MITKLTAMLLMNCLGTGVILADNTPDTTLLVLNKGDETLAIIDPVGMKVVGRVPSGPDPHEVVGSADGRLAFISNYGGHHTVSVVDLVTQKALPAVELGALLSPHGLAVADGRIFFTAEGSKVIGSYDPKSEKIDWVLGLGQNRTHMIVVSKDAKHIFTSNVNSDTISLIEKGAGGGGPGGPGGPRGFGGQPPGGGAGGPPPGGPDGQRGGPGGSGGRGFGPGPGGPPPGFGGPGQGDWNETHVPVGSGPEGFDVSPDGKEVWAANSHDGTVSIIDVTKKAVIETLKTQTRFANRLKFTPDGKLVFISDLGGNNLLIIDAASRKEVKTIDLGGGSAGILMQPDGARAYVAVGSENGVSVIDLKTLEVAGHIESGPDPDGLGWAVRN